MSLKLVYSKDKKPRISKVGTVTVHSDYGIGVQGFEFINASIDEGYQLAIKLAIKELEKKIENNTV